MNFHVGQKVVCIKTVSGAARGSVNDAMARRRVGTANDARYPSKGCVYTIRHINPVSDDCVLLLLGEINNAHLAEFIRGGLEPGFRSIYFRPVVTRKTDISIFKRILNNPHVRIEEDA